MRNDPQCGDACLQTSGPGIRAPSEVAEQPRRLLELERLSGHLTGRKPLHHHKKPSSIAAGLSCFCSGDFPHSCSRCANATTKESRSGSIRSSSYRGLVLDPQ